MPDPINDVVFAALQRALDGVSERQRVISANIANASTPGYRARQVDFEGSLAAALAGGDPSSAAITTTDANSPAKADGNTVDMTTQMMDLQKAGLQYDALVAAMNFKMAVVRDGLGR